MKLLLALLAISALGFGQAAFAADETYESKTKIKADDDGSYNKEVSAEHSDNAGTVSSEVDTNVDVDGNGNRKATVRTKHVEDPKGLMNKHVVKTKDQVKSSNGQVTRHYKKSVDGNTVVDTETDATGTAY